MRALAVIALVVLVAGCGGSQHATYDFQRTQQCVGGASPRWRLPGAPQTFHDLRVATHGDVLFAPTVRAAERFFAVERRGSAKALLRKNAIVVWADDATSRWRRRLLACLR